MHLEVFPCGPCKFTRTHPISIYLCGHGSHILCFLPFASPSPTIPEQKKKQPTSNPNLIPPCACGAERVFETQLLSSLLHVLEVDKHAPADVGGSTASGLGAAYEQGGMNWGNIAIYSCPNVCAAEQEFVVVQDSDERPSQPRGAYEDDAALIPDDATFGGNDDDDDDDWGTDDEQDYDEPDANEDVNSS
jgi:hypothetical protein